MPSLLNRFRKKKHNPLRCAAVVAAAGLSTRMEGQDKLLLPMGELPVLARTLRTLEDCPLIFELVVVTRADLVVPVGQLCKEFGLNKVTKILSGGATRTQSVLMGVREVSADAELIAIHDGARPFVTQALLEQVILRAGETGAAAPAIPVTDTIKLAQGGVVETTLDRSTLFAVQTPQVFEASLIRAALQKAAEDGVTLTDDCAAVEHLGMTVYLTEGDSENIKLTTQADLNFGIGILIGRGECV